MAHEINTDGAQPIKVGQETGMKTATIATILVGLALLVAAPVKAQDKPKTQKTRYSNVTLVTDKP
jgi:hypothetical protein